MGSVQGTGCMERKPSHILPSIGQFLFLVVFLVLMFSPAGKNMLADADTGYHIRAGDYILENRTVPKHDIFSFHSPPLPWTAHEWLSEVVMAALHRIAGLTGVVIFFALLISISYALLFRYMRACKRNIVFDVLILLLALVSSQIHWLARPHIFSLFFMVIWYHLLDSHQNDRGGRLLLLPLIMLLWVNLHGGYLTGFMLTGVYLLGNVIGYFRSVEEERERSLRKIRWLGFILIACLFASLVNPYGYRILLFPFRLVADSYIMDNVNEFLSPNFHKPMPFKYLLLSLVTILALSKMPLDFVEIVLVLLFTNMALYSARYIPLFAIAVAPILSKQADSMIAAASEDGWIAFLKKSAGRIARIDASAKGYLWPIAGVFLVVFLVAAGRMEFRFDGNIKPVAAVEFLMKEQVDGNMYDNDEFGDYLIYATYPRYKVFFDGRSDMYGADRLKEYQKLAVFGPGWEKLVEKYDFGWFFIGSDSVLSRYLLARPGWKLVYSDNVANIHVKNSEQYRYLFEKYRDVRPVVRKDESGEKPD
jgi:hypothetical protein